MIFSIICYWTCITCNCNCYLACYWCYFQFSFWLSDCVVVRICTFIQCICESIVCFTCICDCSSYIVWCAFTIHKSNSINCMICQCISIICLGIICTCQCDVSFCDCQCSINDYEVYLWIVVVCILEIWWFQFHVICSSICTFYRSISIKREIFFFIICTTCNWSYFISS